MSNLTLQQESETMTHIQLAELTSKRADSVKRTIETLSDKGLITFTQIVDTNHQNKKVIIYHVNERDSYIVVAQLSPEFTAFLVDEWQKKKSTNLNLPDFTNPAIAARAWADEVEAKQVAIIQKKEAQKEVLRLQGVCNTITAQFAPGVTAANFARQLNGVNTQKVHGKLVDMGVLISKKGGLVPSSYYRDRYFIERQEVHNKKPRYHAELTIAGAKWLYSAYLSNKLPMKKSWDNKFIHVVFEG